MNIIKASVELVNAPDYQTMLNTIEQAGRVCYKSEDKIEEGSAERFVQAILNHGHEAVIEHSLITVKFICDRGVSHEIVRHRLASYCQESTRYCNYSKSKFCNEITVIEPCYLKPGTAGYLLWRRACKTAEIAYMDMLDNGATPQEARAVLPTSTKTEVVMSANIREWRHFLRLRNAPAAHPQMQEVARMLQHLLHTNYPIFFPINE